MYIAKTLRRKGIHQTMESITPKLPTMPKPINMAQHEAKIRSIKVPKIKTIKPL